MLRAWLLRPESLRHFIRLYDELMLAPSGLTKLEREMIAAAVSAWNRCYYCLAVRTGGGWRFANPPYGPSECHALMHNNTQ